MAVTLTVYGHFEAGHLLSHRPCDKPGHGHTWKVAASLTADVDRETGEPRGAESLAEDLRSVLFEIDGRNLNEMLPGVQPTANGVAAWILERISGLHPQITSVEVWQGEDHSGRVSRVPR